MKGAIPFQMVCPQCGDVMFRARIVPRFAGHPELASYVCESCKETITRAEDEGEGRDQ
jgi:transposase-like protein